MFKISPGGIASHDKDRPKLGILVFDWDTGGLSWSSQVFASEAHTRPFQSTKELWSYHRRLLFVHNRAYESVYGITPRVSCSQSFISFKPLGICTNVSLSRAPLFQAVLNQTVATNGSSCYIGGNENPWRGFIYWRIISIGVWLEIVCPVPWIELLLTGPWITQVFDVHLLERNHSYPFFQEVVRWSISDPQFISAKLLNASAGMIFSNLVHWACGLLANDSSLSDCWATHLRMRLGREGSMPQLLRFSRS